MALNQAIEDLKSAGAEIVEVPYRNALKGIGQYEYEILLYEFKSDLEKYLEEANLPYKSLQDLIEANESQKDSIMSIFGQEIFVQANQKGDLSEEAYKDALIKCTKRVGYVIDSVMTAQNLSAIIGPTLGPSWNINHENGDSFNGPSSYSIAAQSGYPSITVPMGFVNDLPVGISFMGGAYQEGTIISLAFDYEVNTKKRQKPSL